MKKIYVEDKYKRLLDKEVERIEKSNNLSFFLSSNKDRHNENNWHIYLSCCSKKQDNDLVIKILSTLNLATHKFEVLNKISLKKITNKMQGQYNVIIEQSPFTKGKTSRTVSVISFNTHGPTVEKIIMTGRFPIERTVEPHIYNFLNATSFVKDYLGHPDLKFNDKDNRIEMTISFEEYDKITDQLSKLISKEILNDKPNRLKKVIANHSIFLKKISEINDRCPTSSFLLTMKAKNSPMKTKGKYTSSPKKGSPISSMRNTIAYVVSMRQDCINEVLDHIKEIEAHFKTETIECNNEFYYVERVIRNRKDTRHTSTISLDEISNGSCDDYDMEDTIINPESYGVMYDLDKKYKKLNVTGHIDDINSFKMALMRCLGNIMKETMNLDLSRLQTSFVSKCKFKEAKEIANTYDVKIIWPAFKKKNPFNNKNNKNEKNNKNGKNSKNDKIQLLGTKKNIEKVIRDIHFLIARYEVYEYAITNLNIHKINLNAEFKREIDFNYSFELIYNNGAIQFMCEKVNANTMKETIKKLESEVISFNIPRNVTLKNCADWLKSRNCKLDSGVLIGKQSDIEDFKDEFLKGILKVTESVIESREIILFAIKKKFAEIGKAHKAYFIVKDNEIEVIAMKDKIDDAVKALKDCIAELESQIKEEEIKIHDQIPVIAFDQNDIKRIAKDTRINITFPETLASFHVEGVKVELLVSDITAQHGDAIVNSSNTKLKLGSGVSGALAKAAGDKLQLRCDRHISQHGSLKIGDAIITKSYKLKNKAKYIIHAVGPKGNDNNREELMKKAIFSIFNVATGRNLRSIVMPVLSVGIFGYPIHEAAKVYSKAFSEYFSSNPQTSIEHIKILSIRPNDISHVLEAFKEDHVVTFDSFRHFESSNHQDDEYQWYWTENNGTLIKFNSDQNHQIEENRKEGKKNFFIKDAERGMTYQINLTELWELNTYYKNNYRKIVSKPINKVSKPNLANSKGLTKKEFKYKILIQGLEKNIEWFKEELEKLIKLKVLDDFIPIPNIWDLEDEYTKNELKSICERLYIVMGIASQGLELLGVADKIKQAKIEINKLLSNENRFPSYWEPKTSDDFFKLFPLANDSKEWNFIENEMKKTLPNMNIQKIERVQTPSIWKKYISQKNILADRIGSDKVNEKYLFHGTRDITPYTIYANEYGFDMRHSKDGMWGRAIYFAVNASYSHSYSYTSDQEKQFFLARVLVGDTIKLNSDKNLIKPPNKDGFMLYDSVTGETGGSQVFMIYENGRAYPEYLITYKE